MKIEWFNPPNYADIVKVLPAVARRTCIFTYGDTIFNPHKIDILPPIHAHELEHCNRQGGAPGLWWQRYLADPAFRFTEELYGHVAEYRALTRMAGVSRHIRRGAHHAILQKLGDPLYRGGVRRDEIRRLFDIAAAM